MSERAASSAETAEASETAIARTLATLDDHGDQAALSVDDGKSVVARWTYRDMLSEVYRESRRLDACGVPRGDVVAVLTGDTPRTFVLRWAVNTVGAAVTVLADGFAAAVIADLLHTCGAGWVVTDSSRYSLVADAVARLAHPVTVLDLDATPAPQDDSPCAVRARPGDLSSISLTSGSTGRPKAVPRYGPRLRPSPAAPASTPSPWRDAVQLLCTPVAHLGGNVIAQRVFATGGRVVLQAGFDPASVLSAIARENVTTVHLMPRLLHELLDHPGLATSDTSSVRSLLLGGAPASPDRVGEAVGRFGPIVAQGYGTTEAGNICWITENELAQAALRDSVGRAVDGAEVSVREPVSPGGDPGPAHQPGSIEAAGLGAALPTGRVGEVWVRTPMMMSGYLGDPEQTSVVLRGGWLSTGDLGSLDADGYLRLVGRTSEVIFAEHARVYPTDVEDGAPGRGERGGVRAGRRRRFGVGGGGGDGQAGPQPSPRGPRGLGARPARFARDPADPACGG